MPLSLKCLLAVTLLLPGLVSALASTPVGLWKTIDDVTGKERS